MLIENARIIYTDRIQEGSVRVSGGKITEINPAEPVNEEILHARGLYLSPGFIDIHIHGAGGRDIMEGTKEAMNVVAKSVSEYGTTSFVPTTMTMDIPSIHRVLATVKEMKEKKTAGANILGVHLEGPFISPHKLGAQNSAYVLVPEIENIKKLTYGYESAIITVTLAPEMIKDYSVISYLTNKGIRVSMGHTTASYEQAMAGIEAGITHATHLYNAMTPLGHRNPGAGVVGAVFDSNITAELIADGIHIDYPALRIALKQKGTDAICLITDAMMGCTMPDGEYELGGQTVYLKNGMAKLKDGTFAGTLLTLDEAIRQLKNHTDYQLYDIVKMASWNPAKYCGADDRKGRIEKGYDADLVLFDEDIRIRHVMIAGKMQF